MWSTVARMADVLRSCSKTACRWPAAASLSYRYATRQVWLLDLASPDPSLYDLCPHHADHLVVPQGWERVDDRTTQEVVVEPSAVDRAKQAARRRTASAADPSGDQPRPLVSAAAGKNRYAALAEQLPRLAAEAGVPGATSIRSGPLPDEAAAQAETAVRANAEASAWADSPPARASEPAQPPVRQVQHARSLPPVPSRDLAPVPPGGSWDPPQMEEPPIPGQLAIPVDEFAGAHTAVIVPFDAETRRRSPRK
ncbi:MAG: DUF3499 family protein [Nitriliruptorales bacterium]|nr:DUF3499 family protein [Nitriliruptorales bacterium]